MRSVPYAMTWELLFCNRWWMLAGALWAFAFPAFVFNALQRSGGIDHSVEAGFVTIHVTFVLISMFVFGAAVFGTQAPMSRLYPLPVRTGELVVWRLAPAMAAMVIQSALSTTALNAAFELGWPVWGPAWFSAVAFGGVMVAFWLLENQVWMPLGIGAVGAVLGLWFKSHYGGMFSMPSHMWTEMSPWDVVTLALGGLGTYAAGVFAVARNRRGDSIPSSRGTSGVEWSSRGSRIARRPFKSVARAQFWYDWRRAGWVYPGVVAAGQVAGLLIWCIFVRDMNDLDVGYIGGGMMLPAVAVITGLALGSPGTRSQIGEMGNFAATRPVPSSELANGGLRVTAASVLAGWLVWFVPFLILRGVFYASGHVAQSVTVSEFWLTAGGLLAGAWTLASLSAAVQLTGRTVWFAIGLIGFFAGWIGLMVLAATALPAEVLSGIVMVLDVAFRLALVGGIGWAFWQAWRRRLAQPSVVAVAIAICVASAGGLLGTSAFEPDRLPLDAAVFLSWWSLLAVIPVATFPLALAWNRVR